MTPASVGFQCPSCLAEGRATTRQPLSGQPVVTLGIMAACVAAYAVTMLTGGATSPLHEWGAMLGRSAANSDGTVVTGVADGAWWRLVTSAFLHYPVLPFGLVHLVLNMYGLYAFGPYVESVLGRWRFALAYLTMAVGASVAVYWLANPLAPTIGASGAVFGPSSRNSAVSSGVTSSHPSSIAARIWASMRGALVDQGAWRGSGARESRW